MKKVLVGKIHNTHGLNGEVKVSSSFLLKNKVFIKGFKVYIDDLEYIINSYRTMNNFDLLSFASFDNIDKVSNLKNKLIYINRDDLKLESSEYIYDDLIDFSIICNNEFLGKVINYEDGLNKLLVVEFTKNYYIPISGDYIKKIDLDKKVIEVNQNTKELIL